MLKKIVAFALAILFLPYATIALVTTLTFKALERLWEEVLS